MFYIVLELQVNNGVPAAIVNVYPDEQKDQAYGKYFTILAAAAVSSCEVHGAYLTASTGGMLENYIFDRREE